MCVPFSPLIFLLLHVKIYDNFDCTKFVEYLTKCNEVLSHVSVLEDEHLRGSMQEYGPFFNLSIVHILSADVRMWRMQSDTGEHVQIEGQWTMTC